MINKKEWYRPASSGDGKIYSCMWTGEKQLAILQIAHGMAEHSGRYEAFASFMAEHGYVVCMEDHAGHGKSAVIKGHFADNDGWEYVLNDMKKLMDEARAEYPDVPIYLMGHSMGSFLSRSYITRYGDELDGCILSGTMGPFIGVPFGKIVSRIQISLHGPRACGTLLDKLSSAGNLKRIQNPINKSAWLSTVDEECIKFAEDPNCGFPFTLGGYRDLFQGLSEINAKDWASKVPKDLPVYLFAGTGDPVGNYGKGPQTVYQRLKDTGHAVNLKLYPGKRHELLNESNRQEVYEDILEWLNEH